MNESEEHIFIYETIYVDVSHLFIPAFCFLESEKG